MIHEDIFKRMALAAGVNPVRLREPWPPRVVFYDDESDAEVGQPVEAIRRKSAE